METRSMAPAWLKHLRAADAASARWALLAYECSRQKDGAEKDCRIIRFTLMPGEKKKFRQRVNYWHCLTDKCAGFKTVMKNKCWPLTEIPRELGKPGSRKIAKGQTEDCSPHLSSIQIIS